MLEVLKLLILKPVAVIHSYSIWVLETARPGLTLKFSRPVHWILLADMQELMHTSTASL
jgi:hypothetical protein